MAGVFVDLRRHLIELLLLYVLFNNPRRYSRFSGSRKLSFRIVLTGLLHKFSGVKAEG